MAKQKLSPLALGLSAGILWGLSTLIMGLMVHYFAFGTEYVTALGNIYVGYGESLQGSIIGGAMGFVHGLVYGALIAWIYNFFAK